MTVLLALPYTTPPLSLNSRDHWATRHRKTAKLRAEVGVLAKHHKVPAADKVAVALVWQPRDRRRRDADNPFPTIKAAVDGLVDAGVIPDDHHGHVRHDGVRLLEPEPGQKTGRLWLEITPL